jgi:hypothetical protein
MEAGTRDHIWRPLTTQAGWRASLWRMLQTRVYWILSDEILIQRARAGDYAAFDALVARYRHRLYALALDSLGNEDAAGEALCEIARSAFKDIDSFDSNCTPGTWLYLHGFRVVFRRMNLPPGRYSLECRPAARAPSVDRE